MIVSGALRRLLRRSAVLALRYTPLSWHVKRWTVWFLSPRFGLGVHAVVVDAAGRVLALRSAYSGRWQLPGGGVHFDESLEEAVRREVTEELGLASMHAELVEIWLDVRLRGVQALFRVELPLETFHLSEEHTAWRYAAPEELPPFYRRCAERVLGSALSDHARRA